MRYLDLSHPLHNEISIFPGASKPNFDVVHTIAKDGFTERRIQMTSHMNTHIDAPIHIIEGTKTLDEFPMEKFIGTAMVLDCSDYKNITIEHLNPYR
ncbi:MAG: cyclase family protein, partial [Bacteroidota bacterium]